MTTTTTAPVDPTEIRGRILALLGHVPSKVALDLADLWTATAAAFTPGAVVGSDVGVVRYDPDPRFPDSPFVRDFDETRWGLRDLGGVYLLDPEPVAAR